MPILVITLVFFLLSGALWYVRPNPHVWLFGSVALGIGWGAAFMWLITRRGGSKPMDIKTDIHLLVGLSLVAIAGVLLFLGMPDRSGKNRPSCNSSHRSFYIHR